jgi:hypothetical protein
MTRVVSSIENLESSILGAVTGGQNLGFVTQGRQGSENILDCRGDTCLDSTGKVDWAATRAHKYGIQPPPLPLPTGDGGGLGTPKVPDRRPEPNG